MSSKGFEKMRHLGLALEAGTINALFSFLSILTIHFFIIDLSHHVIVSIIRCKHAKLTTPP